MSDGKMVGAEGSADALSPDQLKEMRKFKRLAIIGNVINRLIVVAGFVLIVYFVTDALKEFAGKKTETYLQILSNFLDNLKVGDWISYFFGITVGGTGFACCQKERKLRKRKTKYLAGRVSKLERNVDPSRTSSSLKPTGETREGD